MIGCRAETTRGPFLPRELSFKNAGSGGFAAQSPTTSINSFDPIFRFAGDAPGQVRSGQNRQIVCQCTPVKSDSCESWRLQHPLCAP